MNSNTPLYRACVGIALFNDKGNVFVGERIDTPGAWQMPQGGIDAGETPEQAAFRELKEEIGTNKAEIIATAPQKLRYDLPPDVRQRLWNGKYAGQEQTWIAAKFTGDDQDIKLDTHEQIEFSNWQWVPLENSIQLIVPFKKDVYKNIIEIFKDIPQKITG